MHVYIQEYRYEMSTTKEELHTRTLPWLTCLCTEIGKPSVELQLIVCQAYSGRIRNFTLN